MRLFSTSPPALSAICIVRHGVAKGALRFTLAPSAEGVRIARKRPWPSFCRFIPE